MRDKLQRKGRDQGVASGQGQCGRASSQMKDKWKEMSYIAKNPLVTGH